MAENVQPIALRVPQLLALLEQAGTLDKRTRKLVEEQLVAMARVVAENQAAQDATSRIYIYSLWKADGALTAAELIRAMRVPFGALAELDGLDATLRQQYLEQVERIAARGAQKIMDRLER